MTKSRTSQAVVSLSHQRLLMSRWLLLLACCLFHCSFSKEEQVSIIRDWEINESPQEQQSIVSAAVLTQNVERWKIDGKITQYALKPQIETVTQKGIKRYQTKDQYIQKSTLKRQLGGDHYQQIIQKCEAPPNQTTEYINYTLGQELDPNNETEFYEQLKKILDYICEENNDCTVVINNMVYNRTNGTITITNQTQPVTPPVVPQTNVTNATVNETVITPPNATINETVLPTNETIEPTNITNETIGPGANETNQTVSPTNETQVIPTSNETVSNETVISPNATVTPNETNQTTNETVVVPPTNQTLEPETNETQPTNETTVTPSNDTQGGNETYNTTVIITILPVDNETVPIINETIPTTNETVAPSNETVAPTNETEVAPGVNETVVTPNAMITPNETNQTSNETVPTNQTQDGGTNQNNQTTEQTNATVVPTNQTQEPTSNITNETQPTNQTLTPSNETQGGNTTIIITVLPNVTNQTTNQTVTNVTNATLPDTNITNATVIVVPEQNATINVTVPENTTVVIIPVTNATGNNTQVVVKPQQNATSGPKIPPTNITVGPINQLFPPTTGTGESGSGTNVTPQSNVTIVPVQNETVIGPIENGTAIVIPPENQNGTEIVIIPSQNETEIQEPQNETTPSQNETEVPSQNETVIPSTQNETESPIQNQTTSQNETEIQPAQNETISPPTQNETQVPEQNETIVIPVQNETTVEPSQNETVIPPVQNETEVPSQQNETVSPVQNETVIEPPSQNETIVPPFQNETIIPEQNETAQNETEAPSNETSGNQTIVKPVDGCIKQAANGSCTQCNQYSILDEALQMCFCEFNFTLRIREVPFNESLPTIEEPPIFQDNETSLSQLQNQTLVENNNETIDNTTEFSNQTADSTVPQNETQPSDQVANTTNETPQANATTNITDVTNITDETNVTSPNITVNQSTYAVDMYNFLAFDPAIYDQAFPCYELFLFIFENQTTIEQFSDQVDSLICVVSNVTQPACEPANQTIASDLFRNQSQGERNDTPVPILCDDTMWTTKVEILNFTKPLLDAFVNQLIFMTIDTNYIVLECSGFVDYQVTSDNLDCKMFQDYCDQRDQALVDRQDQLGQENPIFNDEDNCILEQNITVSRDSLTNANSINAIFYNVQSLPHLNTENFTCSDLVIFSDTFQNPDTLQCSFQTYTNIIQQYNNATLITIEVTEIQIGNITNNVLTDLLSNNTNLTLNMENFNITCESPPIEGVILFNFTNATITEVQQCPSNCRICSNSSCSLCNDGYQKVRMENSSQSICVSNQCDFGQVFDEQNLICVPCPSGCRACQIVNNATQCLQCEKSYFRFDLKQSVGSPFACVLSCPNELFTDWENKRCTACDPNCLECRVNPRTKCEDNKKARCESISLFDDDTFSGIQSLISKKNYECLNDCPSGFYNTKGNWCQECPTKCKGCDSYDNCTECIENYRLINGTCSPNLCNLETQYFDIELGDCRECERPCLTCSGASGNCTSCFQGWDLNLDSGQCFPSSLGGGGIISRPLVQAEPSNQCPRGQAFDARMQKCADCPAGCLECSNPKNCTLCPSNLYYIANYTQSNSMSCIKNCPEGYYNSNDQQTCIKCGTPNCAFCSPASICWTCNKGFYKSRSTCFQSCPKGQYIGTDFLKYYLCKNCPNNCRDCSSGDTCNQCAPGTIKVESQYSDISTAVVQKALKQSCVTNSTNCPPGTFYNRTSKTCRLCPRGCASCDRNGECIRNCSLDSCQDCLALPSYCIQCQEGQVLIQEGNGLFCREECEVGLFYSKETLSCNNCTANCTYCIGGNDCIQCRIGTFKAEVNGTTICTDKCNQYLPGSYGNIQTGQCELCGPNCLYCESHHKCLMCDRHTTLDKPSGNCLCDFKYSITPFVRASQIHLSLFNIVLTNNTLVNNALFNCSHLFDLNSQRGYIIVDDFSSGTSTVIDPGCEQIKQMSCYAEQSDDNQVFVIVYNVTQEVINNMRELNQSLTLKKDSYFVKCFGSELLGDISEKYENDDEEEQGTAIEISIPNEDLSQLAADYFASEPDDGSVEEELLGLNQYEHRVDY